MWTVVSRPVISAAARRVISFLILDAADCSSICPMGRILAFFHFPACRRADEYKKRLKARCLGEFLPVTVTHSQVTWFSLKWDSLTVFLFFFLRLVFIVCCFPKWIKTENYKYYALIRVKSIPTIRNSTYCFFKNLSCCQIPQRHKSLPGKCEVLSLIHDTKIKNKDTKNLIADQKKSFLSFSYANAGGWGKSFCYK